MKLNPFGNSGLSVSPIGIGLAALGRPGYINLGHSEDLNHNYDVQAMEQHAHEVLDAAWANGIRYFDAARSYGRAELFLSSWIAKHSIPPEAITVGSKWGYSYTADWKINAEHHEIKEHSLPVLQRQISESEHLLVDHLSLYQIHSATLESGVLSNQAVLTELAKLRENGLRIGLSLSGSGQAETLRKAMTIRSDGEMLFSSVQATWNPLAQEAGDALSEASEMGMGIIVKEALANGRLTPRNNEPTFAYKRAILNKFAEENNVTIDAVAIAAAIEQPWSDVVLSGAATVQHLESNIKAVGLVGTLDTTELLHTIKEEPAHYWAIRSQLAWN